MRLPTRHFPLSNPNIKFRLLPHSNIQKIKWPRGTHPIDPSNTLPGTAGHLLLCALIYTSGNRKNLRPNHTGTMRGLGGGGFQRELRLETGCLQKGENRNFWICFPFFIHPVGFVFFYLICQMSWKGISGWVWFSTLEEGFYCVWLLCNFVEILTLRAIGKVTELYVTCNDQLWSWIRSSDGVKFINWWEERF